MKKPVIKTNKIQPVDPADFAASVRFFLGFGVVSLLFIFIFIVMPIWPFLEPGEKPVPDPPKSRTQQEIINDLEVQKSEIWKKLSPEQQEVLAYVPYSREGYDMMLRESNYDQFGDEETGGIGSYEDNVKDHKISYLRAVTKIDPARLRVFTIQRRNSVDSFVTTASETITLAGLTILKPEKNTYGWPSGSQIVGSKVGLETTSSPITGYLFYNNGTILNLELVEGRIAEKSASFDKKYLDLLTDPYGHDLK